MCDLRSMNPIILEDMEEIYSRNIKWEAIFNKRVMITGAYGMLASYAVFMLIYLNEKYNASIEILALGRDEQKAKQRFGNFFNKPYFHFIKSDLKKIPECGIFPDYIIHAASFASSQYYAANSVDTVIPNSIGTYNLLTSCIKSPIKSMLFLSSGEVYGNSDKSIVGENDFGKSDPMQIRFCYGESKRMGECLCKCFYQQYGIPVKIARLAHTYGPTMDIVNDKRVFAEFVGNAVRGENIVIKSDGKSKRQFCYLADAVSAFYKILIDGNNGEAYNISNMSEYISILQLAEIITTLFPERKMSIVMLQRSDNDVYMENDWLKNKGYVLDNQKLCLLGWDSVYSVKNGFYRTILSFK